MEVVSIWLAKKLSEHNSVEIVSCKECKNNTFENSQGIKIEYLGIDDSHKILAGADYSILENFFSKNNFDIVILQAGTAIKKCCSLSDVKLCKIISDYSRLYYVLHESPKYHLKRYNTEHDGLLKFALKTIYHKIRYAHGVRAFFYESKKYIFRFVTLSKGCQKEMKDCYGLDSIIMYNPYIFDKNETDFSKKENTVLYAGRLSPEKDVRLILDSWKLLKNSNNWKLKIIGDGNQKEFLGNYVLTEQISNVEFLGAQPHDKVLKEFPKSKIFMLTSFFEGFPTVISEAMNYKNVPVVTRYEGFSDELLKSDNSFICSRNPVEISEKLEILMLNAEVLKSFAENGYSQCREFYDFLEKQNYNLGEYE
ncbi:MAG: glycosyltransferase [Spirochaetales bacterium]|nr:glycosyltransferase [Spirochaetales bacterium]